MDSVLQKACKLRGILKELGDKFDEGDKLVDTPFPRWACPNSNKTMFESIWIFWFFLTWHVFNLGQRKNAKLTSQYLMASMTSWMISLLQLPLMATVKSH